MLKFCSIKILDETINKAIIEHKVKNLNALTVNFEIDGINCTAI